MDEKKHRSYPEAFKLEALAHLERNGKNAGLIERELGITPGLAGKLTHPQRLYQWRRRPTYSQQKMSDVFYLQGTLRMGF